MCGLGCLFHCLEDSIHRTHFIFPHTLSVAGEWLLVEHLTPLSLHSLVYSLKHFLSSMPSLHKPPSVCEMHCTKVFLRGGAVVVVTFAPLLSWCTLHHCGCIRVTPSSVIHLFLPHPSFIAQLLFRMPLCGRGLEAACLNFRLLRTFFFPPH